MQGGMRPNWASVGQHRVEHGGRFYPCCAKVRVSLGCSVRFRVRDRVRVRVRGRVRVRDTIRAPMADGRSCGKR